MDGHVKRLKPIEMSDWRAKINDRDVLLEMPDLASKIVDRGCSARSTVDVLKMRCELLKLP